MRYGDVNEQMRRGKNDHPDKQRFGRGCAHIPQHDFQKIQAFYYIILFIYNLKIYDESWKKKSKRMIELLLYNKLEQEYQSSLIEYKSYKWLLHSVVRDYFLSSLNIQSHFFLSWKKISVQKLESVD